MQARVLGGDGETEAAALAAGPGRVAFGEAVEDVRQDVFGNIEVPGVSGVQIVSAPAVRRIVCDR